MKTSIMTIPIPHLCVITAADIEFKIVTSQLENPQFMIANDGVKICQGRAGRNRVTVLQSTIGAKEFKEKLQSHLCNASYDALFIIGLAGGLTPALKTGEVIFYDTCFSFHPEFVNIDEYNELQQSDELTICDFQTASALRQLLLEEGQECLFGAGLTIDFMVTTAREKLALGETYGASAVDMESFDIINTGIKAGLPVVVIRAILDEATQKTPDFNLAIEPDGQMNLTKTLLAMTLRPFATISFFFSLRTAAKALRRATRITLKANPTVQRPAQALLLARSQYA